MEVSSGDEFRELSSISYEVKQFTSTHVLQYDSKALVSRFILFFVGGGLPDINEFN